MSVPSLVQSVVLASLLAMVPLPAQSVRIPMTLMSFDDATGWTAVPSDGVRLALRADSGIAAGRALRFDFDFQGHAGYAVARHSFTLPPLPPHWVMTLQVRGEALPNTLEIKFVDSSGQNVWWMRRTPLTVTRGWTTLRFRTFDLSYAWGPLGGGPPRAIAAMEIAITAGAGGNGWIALDDLALVPLPLPVANSVRPRVLASSSANGVSPAAVLGRHFARAPQRNDPSARSGSAGWRSSGDGEQQLTFDFGGPRELSGLAFDWDDADWATDYDVQRSDDGVQWTTVREVRGSAGSRRFVHLPELESEWLRLVLRRSSRGTGYRLAAMHLLPATTAPTRSAFLEAVADAAPLGHWPRALTHQQSYWTVVGLPRDERDALISEDGIVESKPGSFSLEPFLFGDEMLTWRDGRTSHALDGGWRPIPQARRVTKDAALEVTALATGATGHSVVWVRYRVVNRRAMARTMRLAVALRPVQVNPPWQFLGVTGGAASIRTLGFTGRALTVNDSEDVVPITPGSVVGVRAFDAGSVVDALRRGDLPKEQRVSDPTAFASGAFMWTLALRAHDSTDVWVALPADRADTPPLGATGAAALDSARLLWDRELGAVHIDLPGTGAAMARTVRTSMANVLINARGPAIQPGTRSYRRSWIRDGALTSAALLRLGHSAEVRAFLDWFVPFQFADGKVPCCVDARGADPVTENDADGELLYLAAEYWRMTGDTPTIVRHWPALAKTAVHLDSLRRSRRTAMYQSPESLLVFGLLPPSISHEGYSAKPAYSYWDNWWGVRGMADAALLARVAGDTAPARVLARSAREFRGDVVASVARSMQVHKMKVMPGAADLGDFDPTSSTIALEPAQALFDLPPAVLAATFDSAWANFRTRRGDGDATDRGVVPKSAQRDRGTCASCTATAKSRSLAALGTTAPKWEIYTPYEWRQVGSFIRLDQPVRAHELAGWYMATRRPLAWNGWSEAIWREPRAPKFIGDMPHGWVASDFIRATLDLLVYERESDSTLVVGAGIPLEWARARGGVTARGIHSWWGTLDLTVRSVGRTVRYTVAGVRAPGGIEVCAPFGAVPRAVRVNGRSAELDGRVVVVSAPAVVEFEY